MLKNLKIDIIYYETPSDFEFEFNLGGCCHCRVLNNTTSSPKELIGCLSKAVARSRVIIVVGNFNQPNGLCLLISKAIGRQLTSVSADEYGIIESSNTTVIEGSLPLVSSDGLLSGCIIESGPQSIILLPDEKSLRKDIAENLVFQYISAVSRTPETDSVISSDSTPEAQDIKADDIEEVIADDYLPTEEVYTEDIPEEIVTEALPDETEDILNDVEEIFDNNEKDTDETENISEETLDVEEIIISDNADGFFDISVEKNEKKTEDNFVYSNNADSEYDNDYETNESSKDKSMNLIIWIIIGLMFIVIGILAYMLIYTPLKNGVNITEYVKQLFSL